MSAAEARTVAAALEKVLTPVDLAVTVPAFGAKAAKGGRKLQDRGGSAQR
jgi:hypothetical protein